MTKKLGSKLTKRTLTGSMLVIDPSSGSGSQSRPSNCGYALFYEGQCVDSGIIKMDHDTQSWYRLRHLVKALERDFDAVNLLVVERLTGPQIHSVLHQAVGAIFGGLDFDQAYEIAIPTWQAIAKRLGGWIKTDESDAKYMGYAMIVMALGYEYCRPSKNNVDQQFINDNALKQVVQLQGGKL